MFAKSEHISEPKFTVSIAVAYLALSRDVASLTCNVKVYQCIIVIFWLVIFVESVKGRFSENEITFIRIIFNRSSENDVAQFQLCDRGTLNERSLIFVFV